MFVQRLSFLFPLLKFYSVANLIFECLTGINFYGDIRKFKVVDPIFINFFFFSTSYFCVVSQIVLSSTSPVLIFALTFES